MSSVLATLRRWLTSSRDGGAAASTGNRWIVVDTETSGLDPKHAALLAIGAVAVDERGVRIDDSFEVVVQSDRTPDAANAAVHGLGHSAQAAGTPAAEALASFARWAAGAPRVGFHAEFDRAVLRNAFDAAGIADDDAPWLDLAPLAAALVPDTARRGARSFDDWLSTLRIECVERHNAAADALAAAEVLLYLQAAARRQGAHGFDALRRTARQQRWLVGGS
jgi:DNA polymerase-3 subunit epsilon